MEKNMTATGKLVVEPGFGWAVLTWPMVVGVAMILGICGGHLKRAADAQERIAIALEALACVETGGNPTEERSP